MAWLILALGCGTDPSPEQCASGTDEDQDGLVDCEDGDCFDACSTLTLELDEGWGDWSSRSSYGFESRGGHAQVTLTDVTGHATLETPASTLDCAWTAERMYMKGRWAEYSPGGFESSMTGLDSTGGCGLTTDDFFGGEVGFDDSGLGGRYTFVMNIRTQPPVLSVYDTPWIRGTFTSSDSGAADSSSGIYGSAWNSGQGPVTGVSPWVQGGLP